MPSWQVGDVDPVIDGRGLWTTVGIVGGDGPWHGVTFTVVTGSAPRAGVTGRKSQLEGAPNVCEAWPVTQPTYFSDRHGPATPRVHEDITPAVWAGVATAIQQRLNDGTLARAFPDFLCPDYGNIITGTDESGFSSALLAHIPQVEDSLSAGGMPVRGILPPTPVAQDVIEFVGRHLEAPQTTAPHAWNGHHHHYLFASGYGQQELQERAQTEFRTEVETLFARNGMAYTFDENLCIQRLGPLAVREVVDSFFPATGDTDLDAKLNDALRRFRSAHVSDREDAVEKLWDAYERLKTLELGTNGDKKRSAEQLVDRAAKGLTDFRKVMNDEFSALNFIGNEFGIRHHSLQQKPLPGDDATDYLFARLLVLIEYVLRATGRLAP